MVFISVGMSVKIEGGNNGRSKTSCFTSPTLTFRTVYVCLSVCTLGQCFYCWPIFSLHFIITTIAKGESCVLQCLYEGQRTTLWVLGLTLVTWLAGQLPLPTVPYCLPSVPHLYPVSRQRKIIKDTKLMVFFLAALWV